MTQEQKQLLLKDLCARLPYGYESNIPCSNSIDTDFVSRITLQMTMKWLREVHKLHITATLTYDSPRLYEVKIMRTDVCEDVVLCPEKGFDKLEEAYETAIKYCLENLI